MVTRQKNGFSIIELSIVLVILGLIVSGISAGRHLLKSSQINRILTDFEQYRYAITQFEDNYHFLPGDMPNATDYWPNMTVADQNDPTTQVALENGDGDGFVTYNTGSPAHLRTETFLAWRHLYEAGLIKKFYTGAGQGRGQGFVALDPPTQSVTGNNQYLAGTNVPKAQFKRFGHQLIGGTMSGNGVTFSALPTRDGDDAMRIDFNVLTLQSVSAEVTSLTPALAAVMDQKFDDGEPQQGKMFAYSNLNVEAGQSLGQRCSVPAAGGGAFNFEFNFSATFPLCTVMVRLPRDEDRPPSIAGP